MVIASKFGPTITDGKMGFDASPAALHKGIDEALQRLGVDYMDVWVLRNPGFLTAEQVEEIMGTVKVRQKFFRGLHLLLCLYFHQVIVPSFVIRI